MATPTQTGTVAHDQKAGGGFPPFQGDTFASQLLWFAIAFGLLYWLMNKTIVPRISSIIEERSDRISADLDEAQKLKADSDAAIASYEKSLADARANAQAIASTTRAQVQAEADANRKALETKLSADLAAAEAEITKSKAAAMTNVRGIAVDTAGVIVEQLMGKAVPASELETAVDAVLKG
ncbi:MAG: F0F1 ATP synthase subunit B [Alphaproteobacteria bacterium]